MAISGSMRFGNSATSVILLSPAPRRCAGVPSWKALAGISGLHDFRVQDFGVDLLCQAHGQSISCAKLMDGNIVGAEAPYLD